MKIQFNYILILLVILVDIFNLNQLWRENYIRRVLHHLQRSLYNQNKIPEIYLNQKLEKKDIIFLENLKYKKKEKLANTKYPFLSDFVTGIYTKKPNIFYDDFDYNTKKRLKNIGLSLIPKFEKLINKKLYLDKNVCFILRYEGENAHFNWHYDNEHKSCYRALFLIKKKGKIPDFMYKDINGKIQYIKYNLGEGILLKGKFTHHCVNKSNNKNTLRYVISFQYTTNPNHYHKSICSELSNTTIFQTIKILLPNVIIYWIITIICLLYFNQFVLKIDIQYLIILGIIFYIYLSKYSNKTPMGYGNKININLIFLLKFITFILLNIISPNEAIVIGFYILLTESIFPKKYLILK